MAKFLITSELNCADYRRCGEISALVSEDKPEFYLNCAFCEFTYLQLNVFVQHIYDYHLLEFSKSRIKPEPLAEVICPQEYKQENLDIEEESEDYVFLPNDSHGNQVGINFAVDLGELSQDAKKEENMGIINAELNNGVDVKAEMLSNSEDVLQNGAKLAHKNEAKNNTGFDVDDLDIENNTVKADKNQNESKPIAKEIKLTDTILDVAQCILLSATYKEYACLWNEQDIAYRFKNRRDDAFKSVRENFNEKSGLHLTEYEFEREVLRLRKICTYEKKQKIACKKKNIEYKSSYAHYDHLEYLEVDVAPFVCSICGEQYTALGKLKVHVALHDGSLPFKCNICGHGFQLGCNLTTHLRRHAQDYTYYCEVCNKGLATATDKKAHMRTHTGEKPYVCYTCGSSFATSSRLGEHTKTRHKKHRCYKCDICSKAFYTSKVLKEHKKLHVNVREHVCEICEKAFKCGNYLKKHKRMHDSEKRCICKICGKLFASSSGLCVHMKSHGARTTKNDTDDN